VFFSNTSNHQFPITLIAIEENNCLGTVSIFENNMESREIYRPWLASLYTKPEHRSKSVGQKLISETLKIVKNLGYTQLYLRTEHTSEYYRTRGWQLVESLEENGQKVDIFKYNVASL
jgi:N-acetylglutamate synthase-like GNAT family acetyltransferase